MIPTSRFHLAALAVATLTLAGCTSGKRSPSGFLTNFAQLDAGHGTANAVAAYIKPGADLKAYDSVIIDPVTTVIATPGISPQVQAQLAAYLNDSLRNEIGANMKRVSTPGPKTLRVRVALTDVLEGAVGISPVTTVHANPHATLTGQVGSPAVAAFISRLSFEGELVDSVTGERLVAMVDHRLGSKREVTATTTWAQLHRNAAQGAARLYQRFLLARGA